MVEVFLRGTEIESEGCWPLMRMRVPVDQPLTVMPSMLNWTATKFLPESPTMARSPARLMFTLTIPVAVGMTAGWISGSVSSGRSERIAVAWISAVISGCCSAATMAAVSSWRDSSDWMLAGQKELRVWRRRFDRWNIEGLSVVSRWWFGCC